MQKAFPIKRNNGGFSLLETMVSIGALVSIFFFSTTKMVDSVKSLVTLEVQGEVHDLRKFVTTRTSCQQLKQVCATPGLQEIRFDSCKTIGDYTKRFELRAVCPEGAQSKSVNIEYLLKSKSNSSKVARHPITGAQAKWTKLAEKDLDCNENLVMEPHMARIAVENMLGIEFPYHSRWKKMSNSSRGGAAAFSYDENTLQAICKTLNHPVLVSAKGPDNWSSCGDNQHIRWENGEFKLGAGCAVNRYLIRGAKIECAKQRKVDSCQQNISAKN